VNSLTIDPQDPTTLYTGTSGPAALVTGGPLPIPHQENRSEIPPPKVLWGVVKDGAARSGIEKLALHDLRRTCAHLCHLAGGELDQI
jgi:hypothetical protein